MSKTNVAVLNSDQLTSCLPFDELTSFVQFVAMFVDEHTGWDRRCELIIVHKNNQVSRIGFRVLQDLIDFTCGIQVAGWLSTPEGATPALNYLDWLNKDFVSKVYDSREEVESTPGWLEEALKDAPTFDDEESPC